MNIQKKLRKLSSMIAILLLITMIFIPENTNQYAVAGIGIVCILLLSFSIFFSLLPKLTKLKFQKQIKEKGWDWNVENHEEPISDIEKLLWRQISYQITDKLQAAFPNATWEFQKNPSMDELLCGTTIRLRTFHTGDYNFAETRMNPYGYLELQMLTIANLKKTASADNENQTPSADPEAWYSLIGKKKLENLIGQLHAKGHHKLYINETGQIYIQNGNTPEIKDCFDYFPPRNYWDVLISIFQKDELTAEETDQALKISWGNE